MEEKLGSAAVFALTILHRKTEPNESIGKSVGPGKRSLTFATFHGRFSVLIRDRFRVARLNELADARDATRGLWISCSDLISGREVER
jgi:hypothetical protein